MIKDITLGQFFPNDTIIHRLDPRVKLVICMVFLGVLFSAKGLFAYLMCAALILLGVYVGKINFTMLMRSLKPIVFIVIFTGILNVFYTKGEPLIQFWIITITKEGLVTAAFMTARIIMLISITSLLTYTTSPISLTDGLESLLSPLKKIRFPVHDFSMMMTIALRFIPTLIEETDKIMSAQKARGADFESGNIIRRAKALIPILVPLFVSAFRRADELAVAMECRLYRGGEGRTRLKVLRMDKEDFWFSVFCIFAFGAIIYVSITL